MFSAMHWNRNVLCTLLALVVGGGGVTTAQDKTVKDSKREADRRALDKLSKDMIQAFDKRDAAAIAAGWTEEGESIRNDGEPIRGRAAIEKGYAEFFRTLKGRPKLEIQFGRRSLSVRGRGRLRSHATAEELRRENRDVREQETVLVRDGDQWKVAIVREWDRDLGLDVSLKELEWLIGTWQAVAKGREVIVTYEWDGNQAFLHGSRSKPAAR